MNIDRPILLVHPPVGRPARIAGARRTNRNEEDQGKNHETAPLDQPEARGINCNLMSQTFQKAITSGSPIYLTTDSQAASPSARARPSKKNDAGTSIATVMPHMTL